MSKLFEELKRRKVFRVAAAYAVVAWLLIQVADTVLPTFGAPAWVNQTLIFLFLLGFPIAIILAWAYEITPGGIRADSPNPNANTTTPASDRKLIYATFALVLLVAGFQIADRFLAPAEPSTAEESSSGFSGPETRLDIVTPDSIAAVEFALSPDGRKIVFVASDDRGVSKLWLRSLADATAEPLAGTDNARRPFWSPGGGAIGFFADTTLMRLDLGGDAPQALVTIRAHYGGAWGADDTILFPYGEGALNRISSTGGEVTSVTTLEPGQTHHRSPHFLPDGRRFLFLARGTRDTSGIYLGDIDGTAPVQLTPAESAGVFHPDGWLLWLRAGALIAQRLDLTRAAFTGEPLVLAEGIATDPTNLGALSVASNGLIAYRSGGTQQQQLTWVDRAGTVQGTLGEPDGTIANPRLSPDGRRVAVFRVVEGNLDVWLLDGDRRSRFTFDDARESHPLWSHDGSRVVFTAVRGGISGLYLKPSNGSGEETRLLNLSLEQYPTATSWSADGKYLLYQTTNSKTAVDLWALPMTSDPEPFLVLQTPFNERGAKISPDGGWVAYESDESGRDEVYVRIFAAPRDGDGSAVADTTSSGMWQVSTAGGRSPAWSPDGRELYYLDPGGNMMAVPLIVTGDTLEVGTPVSLFPARILGGGTGTTVGQQYAVAPDGRFLINTPVGEAAMSPITLILNWRPQS